MFGCLGDDTLNAGTGTNILTGGADNDTFIFVADEFSVNTITDFTAGDDTIDLTNFVGVDFLDLIQTQIDTNGDGTHITWDVGVYEDDLDLTLNATAADLAATDFDFDA